MSASTHRGHEVTKEKRAQVAALASFGIPQEEIAKFIGTSHVTLRKHYNDELELSAINANLTVGKYLFSLASGQAMENGAAHSDCKTAAMFWAKTRMGWRETNRTEITGADGGAVKITQEMTDDLRQALDILAAKIADSDSADQVALPSPAQPDHA